MSQKIFIALTMYLTALIASNTLGIKLMPFIFSTHLSTAIFAFPIVFLMTDVIGEVYGKALSRQFVLMGIYCNVIFLVFNFLSNIMPSSPDFFMKDADIKMYMGNYTMFRLQRQKELTDYTNKDLAYLSSSRLSKYVVTKGFTVWTIKKKHLIGEEIYIGDHNRNLLVLEDQRQRSNRSVHVPRDICIVYWSLQAWQILHIGAWSRDAPCTCLDKYLL
jgi:hypothetical protein